MVEALYESWISLECILHSMRVRKLSYKHETLQRSIIVTHNMDSRPIFSAASFSSVVSTVNGKNNRSPLLERDGGARVGNVTARKKLIYRK